MNFRYILGAGTIVLLATAPMQATAQFGNLKVPGVPNAFGGGASSSFDLQGGQAGFFSSFGSAQSQVLQAQILLAKAFDLKELAEALQIEANYISTGEIDTQGIKNSMQISQSANTAVSEKMSEGVELSDEGKEYFIQSLPFLLQGTVLASKLPAEAQALADGVKSTAQNGNMMQKVQAAKLVAPTATVATAVPGFVRSTFDCYKKVVSYGQQNNLPIPEDATDALGDL